MFQEVGKYRLSFLLYALFLIAGIIMAASVPKFELHVLCNSGHSDVLDLIFSALTWLGDGRVAVVLALAFVFIRFRYAIMLLVSFSVSGLLAQFFKRVVFPDALRPSVYLDSMPGLNFVEGIDLHSAFSFPSGHTTTAFAVIILVSLISRNRVIVFSGIILAWLVAFSRVYLSQHFLVDILAGSLLGIFSALFFYWYFRRFKASWLDGSLIKPGKHKKN